MLTSFNSHSPLKAEQTDRQTEGVGSVVKSRALGRES